MTKQEALQEMSEGKYITHIFFQRHEYVRMDEGAYVGESANSTIYLSSASWDNDFDDRECPQTLMEFFAIRSSKAWEDGYSIFNR
jgi:hypothetical protein